MPVTYSTKPSAPTGTSLDTSVEDEITVTWNDESTGEDGYYVYLSTDGSNFSRTATKGASVTSHTITGLEDGKKYWVYVAAYTDGGENAGGTVSATTALPAPTVNSLTYVADDELELDFSANDDGSSTSYSVGMRRDGSSWVDPAGGPSNPSPGVHSYGPASDASYERQVGADSKFEFWVKASTDDVTGTYDYSDAVYTTPLPPHNPSVSRPDANTFKFDWEGKATDADDANVVTIWVRADEGSGYGSWDFIDQYDQANAPIQFDISKDSRLNEDARHQFRLSTKTNTGSFPVSEYVYADYGNDGNVFFEDDFEDQDFAEWGGSRGNSSIDSGSNTTAQISGADEGTYYANIAGGDYLRKDLGDFSGETDVIIKCTLASGSMSSSSDPRIEFQSDASNWVTPHDSDWSYNRQGWWQVFAKVPNSALGTNSKFQIVAPSDGPLLVDGVVVSDLLHEYTKPAAPSGLQLDNTTVGEISASWTHNSTFAGDRAYIFQDGKQKEKNYPGTSGSTAFTGLSDGEEYESDIETWRYQDRKGESPSNVWRNGSIQDTTITRLPENTSLSASNVQPTSADLTWTNGSGDADAQRVYARQTGNPAQFEWSGLGVKEYITVGAPPKQPQKFTIEYVVEIDALDVDSNNNYINVINAKQNKNFLIIEEAGRVSFRVPGVDTSNYRAGDIPADGTAHRVTCVYDQSDRIIYINGSEVGRETIGSGTVDMGKLRIGTDSKLHNLNGRLRDVALWDIEQTSSEVGEGVEPPHNQSDNIIGYWPLDLEAGGATPDVSEFANDGTVNGPSLVGNTPSDVSGALPSGTTSYNLSSLLEGNEYTVFVHSETEHSKTRDI
jgi:hypothetical protein